MSLFADKTVIDISRCMVPGKINNTFGTRRDLEVEPIIFRMKGMADSRMSILTMHSHIGTHVEMPVHRFDHMMDVAQCPLDLLMGEVRLADVTFAGKLAELTTDDITLATDDDVRPDDTVIVFSSFAPENRPIITLSVVDWLIARGMRVLGFDSMAGISNDAHDRALSANIPLLEELVNLDKVPVKRGTLIALPIAVEGLDSCPVRAVIVV